MLKALGKSVIDYGALIWSMPDYVQQPLSVVPVSQYNRAMKSVEEKAFPC